MTQHHKLIVFSKCKTFMEEIDLPSPHGQIQLHHHKVLDECQEGLYHPQEHLRMATSSSLHTLLYHMRNNQPSHLFRK